MGFTAAGYARELLPLIARRRGLVFPLAIIGAVLVLVVPLPPALMDLLLAANITLSIVILMATISVQTPLELSVFPSLLLGTTLFRLVLNVASTRLILTNAGAAGTAAAGGIIEKFGEMVAGDRMVVGFVIFLIIVVIQFVVVTKGATRISEVAARFVLDSLPGRQMAIDADLSAGLVDEPTARRQREDLLRHADFFGAMDGASRFVRGDAVAGLIITLVNILGGLYVGVVETGMSLADAFSVFTRLTIGDGLASQVPAFIIALGAALLITRSSVPANLGEETVRQVTSHPEALMMAGLFAVLLAATDFPRAPLIVLGGACVGWAVWSGRTPRKVPERSDAPAMKEAEPTVRIEEFLHIDPIELEVGYGLLRMTDRSRGGDLVERLQQLRQQVARRLGLILPKVRIRDNLDLAPHAYRVKVRGRHVADGSIPIDCWLARQGRSTPTVALGAPAPAELYGANSWWIDAAKRSYAERQGFQVLDAAGSLLHHLHKVIEQHAGDLLSRDQVKRLLDSLRATSPALVDEIVPGLLSAGHIHRVLQNLLREGRSIRDLETILEAMSDLAPQNRDIEALTEHVRGQLSYTDEAWSSELRLAAA
jgi:flagellar biosynthesis protein FlhA